MAFSNAADRYGIVTKSFHWLTALLIITLIPLGGIANDMAATIKAAATPDPDFIARTARLFSLHKTLGVAAFFVALARILWALSQPKPQPLHPARRAETLLAETVHWLLYSSLVIVPASGWIMHAASSGFAPIWWPLGQGLPLVPKSEAIAAFFAGTHIVVTKVLLFSLLAHIAGAVKHVVIDRDATLARMWFGRTTAGPTTPYETPNNRQRAAPIVLALVGWATAMGIGAGLGLYAAPSTSKAAAPAAVLQTIPSQWQVIDGRIGLGITQMDAPVTGGFQDWTAAIRFDDQITNGAAGEVETQINIASLTLGSVTRQAMGADFFDVGSHPIAVYQGTLFATPEGYVARGTLTLKGQSVPVEFPFTLRMAGNTATMNAVLSLDRQDFGIGAAMPDENSLGFGVDVTLSLTARKE